MARASDQLTNSARTGFLVEVTLALLFIRDSRASGRLSLRNGEQFGIVHLYFNEAHLIHVASDKHDGESILNDLMNWTKGSVRFDSGLRLTFESITWQQAQIFGRWLAFLEMRGMMQGIAHERLDGLTRSLMAQLPGKPITLPDVVEHYEEYEAAARAQRWRRINEGVHQLVDRALPEEQRGQLKEATRQVTQRVNQVVQQAGEVTQDLAKRASKATQDGLQRTVGSMAEAAQEAARQGTQRAEELVRSPLPPELQALSLRYKSGFQPPSSAAGNLGDGQ